MRWMFLLLFTLLISCSSGKPQKRDKDHQAPHAGIILQGKYLHVEIVGSHSNVKIYPYLLDQEKETLIPLDPDKVKISVEYSPYRSKADFSTYMVKKKDHFWGEIDSQNEKDYQIYIELIFEGNIDRFIYIVRPKK